MKIHGSYRLNAPRGVAFAAICDPGTLLPVIPGCEAIEQTTPTEYRGRIALRLPAVVGTYRTFVRLVETVPPDRARLEGSVEGTLGSIRGTAEFTLTDSGPGTAIEYAGQATIDGPLARLDSRFVESLAGSLIQQGLRSLNERLARDVPDAAVVLGPKPSKESSA